MADFDNAGKLVTRKDLLGVEVKSGETLKFTLNVQGAQGMFAFACEHKTRKSDQDYPGPQAEYMWNWKCPEDADDDGSADGDEYVTRMLFLTAVSYTYKVIHYDSTGNQKNVLKDLDASSTDSQDKYPSSLRVLCKP
jgi:hypothetical protein